MGHRGSNPERLPSWQSIAWTAKSEVFFSNGALSPDFGWGLYRARLPSLPSIAKRLPIMAPQVANVYQPVGGFGMQVVRKGAFGEPTGLVRLEYMDGYSVQAGQDCKRSRTVIGLLTKVGDN
jgi:hypothetical protein